MLEILLRNCLVLVGWWMVLVVGSLTELLGLCWRIFRHENRKHRKSQKIIEEYKNLSVTCHFSKVTIETTLLRPPDNFMCYF